VRDGTAVTVEEVCVRFGFETSYWGVGVLISLWLFLFAAQPK
jgi:hypothetical protein